MATRKPQARQPQGEGTMERHIQTILISLVVGAIGFSASYFFTDKSDKAVLTTQLTQLSVQMGELRGDMRRIQEQLIPREQYNDHENRIRQLEQRSENVGRVFKNGTGK